MLIADIFVIYMEHRNNGEERRHSNIVALARDAGRSAVDLVHLRRLNPSDLASKAKNMSRRTAAIAGIGALLVTAGAVGVSTASSNGSTSSVSAKTFGPWDEQLVFSLQRNRSSLVYDVTAIPSNNTAFLVNGLTNKGYWYQVGLSFNWPDSATPNNQLQSAVPGYNMNFETFNPNGDSIFPAVGGGMALFNGPVFTGDPVMLALFFYKSQVIMGALDLNTNAVSVAAFPAYGATVFVGTPTAMNKEGFSSSIMTERYCAFPNCGPELQQTYTPVGGGTFSGTPFVEERKPSSVQALDHKWVIARGCTDTAVNPQVEYEYKLPVGNTNEAYVIAFNNGTIVTGVEKVSRVYYVMGIPITVPPQSSYTTQSPSEIANNCRPKPRP